MGITRCYHVYMNERVGIRDLRQQASRIVQLAAQGQRIDITDRGRPVAQIGPLPAEGRFAELVAAGRIIAGRGNVLDLEPLPPPPGRPTGSQALADLRADER